MLTRLLLATLACAGLGAPLRAAETVDVANPGFEQTAASSLPADWELDGALPAGAQARRVASGRGGSHAIELGSETPGSITVRSREVRLRIGHLYRLSAWVRTERARADPLVRYPTAVAATISMASFPFTNHAAAVGGTRGWTRIETAFVATAATDRVQLHLGRNGNATGSAAFDDVALTPIEDVTEVIPLERVRWSGPGFRYEERGWIFVHVEGAPYARGRQFGSLVAEELAEYAQKLSIRRDEKNPAQGWSGLRTLADALMLRRFEPEFLEEMRGIADGAAAAGARIHGREVDLVDVVALNSVIDLDQMHSALPVTPNATTGRSFLSAEDELALPERTHKCSSLTATGPATRDGRPVFFQIFMWDGYTGVHFDVILDVVPETGRRFVMQTFPGGIHSGTDFYLNDSGILIGETTVLQTPFDPEGTPQSNRIRKAIQYGASIDEVAALLRERNNGMYTNDWTLADLKTNEAAILLLGTRESKLWRSSDRPAPFGTPGFLWANNNARHAPVRREVADQPGDAPFDSTFTAWNRDLAFQRFYRENRGRIDVHAAVRLMASSPINRPHACDGKVTDAAMAEQLVFLAHQGKVTLREKFPAAGQRRMPDLPGARPHLTHGYAAFSPIVIAEALKAARAERQVKAQAEPAVTEVTTAIDDRYDFDEDDLWRGSIFPASDADNWLVAGGAAYWQILDGLPEKKAERPEALARALGGLRGRLSWLAAREGPLAATRGGVAYDRTSPAFVPRIKGVFALHQLRLLAGNPAFFRLMKSFHAARRGSEVTSADFFAAAREALGRDLEPQIRPWLDNAELPDPQPRVEVERTDSGWKLTVRTSQATPGWRLVTTLAAETPATRQLHPLSLDGPSSETVLSLSEEPRRVVFDALADLAVLTERHHAFSSFAEDFSRTLIVYGTARQIEANRTLALRFQSVLADGFAETLPAVAADAETEEADLARHDLFVLGDPRDNMLLARLLPQLPLETGPGWFRFEGKTCAHERDGLYLALPSPFAADRVLHVLLANSPLQLHEMTKSYRAGLPAFALFHGDRITREGHFPPARFDLALAGGAAKP